MAKQTVPVYTVTSGDRVERARSSLAEALGGAKLGKPDEGGIFAVRVDAESPEEARELVREAFARAGTGDDFVIQETTEGREIADDDPRQGPGEATAETADATAGPGADATAEADAGATAEGDADATAEAGASDNGDAGGESDRSSLVADAASAVAAAASDARSSDAADSARAAASGAADTARDAASSVREAVDEKGIGGAASDYASTAASAAQKRDLSRFAPIGGLLLLLLILRRRRR